MRVLALAAVSLLLLPMTPVRATGQSAEPIRVGGPIPPPQKTRDVKPVYPADAQRARVSGVVVIELTIAEDGNVRNAVVLRSVPMLDQAALDCVRQWQFAPTVVSGKAVPVLTTVTVNFALQGVAPVQGVPTSAAPAASGPIRLSELRAQSGTMVWEIPLVRANRLPHWNPDVALPLSVPDATAMGRSWLMLHNPQIERFEVQSVTLSHIRRSADADFWYYQFNFFGPPGMPLFRVVLLPDGSVVDPAPMQGGLVAPPTPDGTYRPGPGVTTPRLLRDAKPAYTAAAMRAKIEGNVQVECVVGTDGAPHDCRIVRSLDPTYGLDQEALKAAAQWRFEPGTRDGKPVQVVVSMELVFKLR